MDFGERKPRSSDQLVLGQMCDLKANLKKMTMTESDGGDDVESSVACDGAPVLVGDEEVGPDNESEFGTRAAIHVSKSLHPHKHGHLGCPQNTQTTHRHGRSHTEISKYTVSMRPQDNRKYHVGFRNVRRRARDATAADAPLPRRTPQQLPSLPCVQPRG